MLLVLGSLVDPLSQSFDLVRRKGWHSRVFRRHRIAGTKASSFHEQGIFCASGFDGKAPIAASGCIISVAQPKVAFDFLTVGAVAFVAVLTEYWPNISIEIYFSYRRDWLLFRLSVANCEAHAKARERGKYQDGGSNMKHFESEEQTFSMLRLF